MTDEKIKEIAYVCFSNVPDMDELKLFVKLINEMWEKDADDWYEKILWHRDSNK